MRTRKPTALAVAMLVLLLAPGGAARAAERREETPCAGNASRVGDLGIVSVDCDCTHERRSRSTDGRVRLVRRWAFRSEPRVSGIRADGPAAGKLREGDIVTAIDGVLITTREGARRFADVAPGTPATLTVRREGREIPVRIVADGICPELALRPESLMLGWHEQEAPETPVTPETPATPETPRPRRHGRLPMPAIPTEDALPRGWSGFGLTCRNCGGMPGDSAGTPVWEFGTLPTIYFLDPGSPAERAGIQTGDVLTHLDGVSLLTDEGGRRFGALKPGQRVRWTIRRDGRTRSATVVTEPRPGERTIPLAELREKLRELTEGGEAERLSADMARVADELARRGLLTPAPRAPGDRLRYAGAVGSSEVEVRGLGNVVVDDSGDEIVITTRDATIRIRPAATPAATRPSRARAPR